MRLLLAALVASVTAQGSTGPGDNQMNSPPPSPDYEEGCWGCIELQDLGVQKVMLEQSDDLELDLTTWIIPIVLAFVLCIACCALCFCWKAKRPGKRKYPGLRDIEDDGETRELGMKKGASARSWGNLEDPNRTALIKTESFGTSEKYMSARI